jgi:CHAT domain-containing protein/Tfp pilus assembly protein PilF
MKKILLCIICANVCYYSFSQIFKTDTTLANQYFDLARKYENESNFDTAIFYAEKAQTLNIKYFGEKSIKNANVLHLIGRVYYSKYNYDLSLDYNYKALQIRKEILGEKHIDVAKSYNNIGINYYNKYEYDKALEYLFKSSQLYIEILGEKNPYLIQSYYNIGALYSPKGEYDKALEYHFKSLQIRKEIAGEKHPDVATSYNEIGIIYNYKCEYDKALEYYLKALQIRKEILGENHPDVAACYNNVGMVFEEKSEYDKALEYYLMALQIDKGILGEKHPDVATCYNNIGMLYVDKGEYDKAMEYLLEALQIDKEIFGEKHRNTAFDYNGVGYVYYSKGEYDKALEYMVKALQIRKEILGEKHPEVAASYNNIGNIYIDKGEHDKALEYHLKALQIRKEIHGEKHPHLALSYNNLGVICLNMGEYDKALEYYQKEVTSCLYDYNDTINVYNTPTIRKYLDWNYLLQALQEKAKIIADINKPLYNLSCTKRKGIALSHFQVCDTLIDITRKEINKQSDKLALGERANHIYEDAVDLLTTIQPSNTSNSAKTITDNDRNLAFYFSEKNKSSVLLEALAGQEAQKYAGIPDSLLQDEHNLKIDIAFYTKKLAEPEILDSTQVVLYQDRLFRRNRSYDSLITVFEKQFPNYHNLKYNNKPAAVKDIQELLDEKTALISYFTGDSTITIFTLTKGNFKVQKIPIMTSLNDSIVWFRYGLTKFSPRMQEYYRRLGFKLYQQLFPDNASIGRKIKNLVIIPDGSLSTVPFESLLTENYTGDINEYKKYPYLVKKYKISYSYSANLFYLTFSREASSTIEMTKLNDWLAFAPVFDKSGDQNLSMSSRELQKQLNWLKTDSMMINRSLFDRGYIAPLPATEEETEAVFKLYDVNNLKAKVLLHNDASEGYIKSGELEHYKALHFATHGFVNSEKPELSGLLLAQDTTGKEDGVLYSGEIYNLKLNADVVVLSACETGLGKIQKGEGIIGLTRALLYAGAKNIVVSLWRVADESTSDLMVDFYKNNLESKDARSYSEALRDAKLKMINEGKFAHPYFWSPFILIGK